MAKHMAGKNQRPYSAEDRARRAAKADPRSTASELTPETLYAKQSSQSEKRVPSSIENLHFTPKSPKNGPEGFEETREYPAPAAPQQEAPCSERPAPAPAPRPEPYEDEDDYEEYEEYEEGYDDKPRQKRSPVVPIVIVMIVLAIGILGVHCVQPRCVRQVLTRCRHTYAGAHTGSRRNGRADTYPHRRADRHAGADTAADL